jgi:beta-glucanase (GH16 family)
MYYNPWAIFFKGFSIRIIPFLKPFILIILIISLSCTGDNKWRLVWSDEFDYQGEPEADKWTIVEKRAGWVNQENQTYLNRRENIRVENGNLIIEARNDGYGGYPYTSARIDTFLAGKWTYGRIEVRAKLPKGRGTWPAIFMLPVENIQSVYGWPSSGEIDIMEHVGFNPGIVQASIHCHNYNHPQGNQKYDTLHLDDPFKEFHLYALEWYPDRLDFFVDDDNYFTFRNEMTDWKAWPFFKNFYLIICLAIGGTWGGSQGIDNTIFPAQMVIDYVRVYQTDLEKLGYDLADYQIEK